MLLQTPAFGQQSGYDEELGQLSGELRSLLVRVERLDPHLTAMRIELQEQLFDLSNLHPKCQKLTCPWTGDLSMHRRRRPLWTRTSGTGTGAAV